MITLDARAISPSVTSLPVPPPYIAPPPVEDLGSVEWLQKAISEAIAAKDLDRELRYLSFLALHFPRDLNIKLRVVDIFMERHDWEGAYQPMHEVLSYLPTNPEMLDRMGAICAFGSRQQESYKWFDTCERLHPNFDRSNWNRSLALLQQGRWGEAWHLYDWGRTPGIGQRRARHIKPVWDGKPLDGKTLYIWWEQGFGDTLMLWRTVGLAQQRSRCRHVIVEVQADLVPLFHAASDDRLTVVATQEHNNFALPFDEHCSFFDLMKPEVLNMDSPAKFACPPYINPPRGKFGPPASGKRVGVVWKGNAAHFNDRARSIDAEAFLTMLSAHHNGNTFVSLMPDVKLPTDRGFATENILIPTFSHTAEVIAACDLVITVDTAVTHLAGAVGTPTLALITTDPDWRWGVPQWGADGQRICDQRTPIYSSVRLIRQKTRLDWTHPLEFVGQMLGEL